MLEADRLPDGEVCVRDPHARVGEAPGHQFEREAGLDPFDDGQRGVDEVGRGGDPAEQADLVADPRRGVELDRRGVPALDRRDAGGAFRDLARAAVGDEGADEVGLPRGADDEHDVASGAVRHALVEAGRKARHQDDEERDEADAHERQQRPRAAAPEVSEGVSDREHQAGLIAKGHEGRPGRREEADRERGARPVQEDGEAGEEVDPEALDPQRGRREGEPEHNRARPEEPADQREDEALGHEEEGEGGLCEPEGLERAELARARLGRDEDRVPEHEHDDQDGEVAEEAPEADDARHLADGGLDEGLLRLRVGRRLVRAEAVVDRPRDRDAVGARAELHEELGRLAHFGDENPPPDKRIYVQKDRMFIEFRPTARASFRA